MRWLPFLCGSVLVLFGVVLLLAGPLELPTRTPGVESRFAGLVLGLLAASPSLMGAMLMAVGFGADPASKPVRALMLSAIASCGAAFVLAPQS